MKINGKVVTGIFQERPNRFLARVRIGGNVVPCFVPNPGRLRELLIPGAKVLLKGVSKVERKTSYDLIGICKTGQKISIDSRVPNILLLKALRNGDLKEFSKYNVIRPEWNYGHTRFDFFLTDGLERCLLEVKSCTLVRNGRALFPDAPTERGRRHLIDLMDALRRGYRACVLFLVQRIDAKMFSPNDSTDVEFGDLLRQAAAEGVEVYAYLSEFTGNEVMLREKVEVDLSQVAE